MPAKFNNPINIMRVFGRRRLNPELLLGYQAIRSFQPVPAQNGELRGVAVARFDD